MASPGGGRGIGAHVVRRLQRQARASGVRLVLEVLEGNPALRLYERLGFVRSGGADGVVEMESAL